MFLKLAYKTLEERQGARSRTGKARQNLVAEQASRFPGRMFHHVLTHRDLAVWGSHHFIVAAHAKNSSAVHLCVMFPHWHREIIPRAAAATNVGFAIACFEKLTVRSLLRLGDSSGNFRFDTAPPHRFALHGSHHGPE